MGAGRKTQTFTLPPTQDMGAYTTSMRNMRKNELAGVIFGCKDSTIRECLSNKLFGLPAPHFQYVRNISAGLPLFLFNYTDRKLHGIFEAANHGQMNINPCGWCIDGSERTQFPAQVQVRVRVHCRPLPETQFKDIILDNYYTDHHFWFELDDTQTKKLISKLESVALSASPFVPHGPKLPAVADLPSNFVPKISKLAPWAAAPGPSVTEIVNDWESDFPPLPSHPLPSYETITESDWLGPLTSKDLHMSTSCQNLNSQILFGRYDASSSELHVKEDEQVEQESTHMNQLNTPVHGSSVSQGTYVSGPLEDGVFMNERALNENKNPIGLQGKRVESPQSLFEYKKCECHCSLYAQKSKESSHSLSEHDAVISKLVQEVEDLKAFKNKQTKKLCYLEHQMLVQEVEKLKAFKTAQCKKIGALESKLEQAEIEIQRLKVRLH